MGQERRRGVSERFLEKTHEKIVADFTEILRLGVPVAAKRLERFPVSRRAGRLQIEMTGVLQNADCWTIGEQRLQSVHRPGRAIHSILSGRENADGRGHIPQCGIGKQLDLTRREQTDGENGLYLP